MANTGTLSHTSGRDHRRHRALVAHLKACGEWQLAELDHSHPVIASATLAEITAAIQEASRAMRCPLENRVERWMAGERECQFGNAGQWLPLRVARHLNLQSVSCRDGCTKFIYNTIEVFQLCYRNAGRTGQYLIHLQPLSSPESAGYYLLKRRPGLALEESQRLEKPIRDDFPDTRMAHSAMSASMVEFALQHTSFSEVSEWELPLHQYIAATI